ncbi:hypothetical protein M413DRAFT_53895, partial [Hebeloma cylindrosporum]
GTGKSACHLRSPASTGCMQVANGKQVSAVTCVQMNSVVRNLRASANFCERPHFLL